MSEAGVGEVVAGGVVTAAEEEERIVLMESAVSRNPLTQTRMHIINMLTSSSRRAAPLFSALFSALC